MFTCESESVFHFGDMKQSRAGLRGNETQGSSGGKEGNIGNLKVSVVKCYTANSTRYLVGECRKQGGEAEIKRQPLKEDSRRKSEADQD